jgi:shikimate dehydrogenase
LSAGSVLVGLIGAGIRRSLSPALHEEEARHHGLRLQYRLIDLTDASENADDLPRLLATVRKQGFAGVNITHPCKLAVVPLLHTLSDDARQIGAVNTVLFDGDRSIGHNTDWSGFALAFQGHMADAALEQVALLGAGGAGSAVGYAALHLGVGLLKIVDPVGGRAQALAENLARQFGRKRVQVCSDARSALEGAQGLIHATPTGMHGHRGLPLAEALLHPGLWVAEIVYFPLDTELLQTARRRGCRVLDGSGMAVGQAAGAFRLFTGLKPDIDRMEAHFRRLTGARGNGQRRDR